MVTSKANSSPLITEQGRFKKMKNGWKACSWKEYNEYIYYSIQNSSHFMQLKANLTKPMMLVNFTEKCPFAYQQKANSNLYQINDSKLIYVH